MKVSSMKDAELLVAANDEGQEANEAMARKMQDTRKEQVHNLLLVVDSARANLTVAIVPLRCSHTVFPSHTLFPYTALIHSSHTLL
jgi:hypothetical protein